MNFAEGIQILLLEVGVHLVKALRRKVFEREVDAQDLDLAVEDDRRILDLLCGLFTGAVYLGGGTKSVYIQVREGGEGKGVKRSATRVRI